MLGLTQVRPFFMLGIFENEQLIQYSILLFDSLILFTHA